VPLKVLDLSTNDIPTIPPGIFPKLPGLQVCDLSRNKLASLPDDIGALQSLQRLSVAHNKLSSLPDSLCQITTLVWLNIKSNSIQHLRGNIRLWGRLQVLNASNNNLEILPADVGWLPLKELRVSGNPNLRIPQTVLKHGFKAIISYLQVVCEQHRLVERHLSRFTHPDTGADDADAEPDFDSSSSAAKGLSVEQRISEAANTGILDFKGCASSDALDAAHQDLHAVYVADVRSSRCTELDTNILSFENLVILNASFNQISWIADGIVPGSLGVLNASFNKLKELPSSLGSSPVLQQMYLANNQLSDLPESFASLPIVDLFLSENEFTRIPRALLGMGQLAKLSMACCKLQELSEELGNINSLRFLDVSFNELQDLPESLSKLTSLNALNISFNPLQTFPKVIPSLTALLELNLDFTNVSDLPPDIGKLRHLEGLQVEGNQFEEPLRSLYRANPLLLVQVHNTALTSLDLSGIGLTCFPTQLARLTGLSALNLSRNKIPSFPPELGLLTNIRHLSVKENPLVPPFRQIAEAHGSRSIIDYLDCKGSKLDLSNCELQELPEQVLAHGTHLQQLKLANNKLMDLPPSFSTLEALNTLVLDYNALQAVPEVVLKLPKLSILMASCNQITALPVGIGACSNLQAIVLQSNSITELPSSISNLVDLKALGLASNNIQGPLPEFLGSCTALRLLDISSNQIMSLPTSMGSLQKLKTLKACDNQLSTIPQQFRDLRNLQELYLEGNPFKLQGPGHESHAFNASSSSAVRKVLDVLLPGAPSPSPATEPLAAQEQQPQQEQQQQQQQQVSPAPQAQQQEPGAGDGATMMELGSLTDVSAPQPHPNKHSCSPPSPQPPTCSQPVHEAQAPVHEADVPMQEAQAPVQGADIQASEAHRAVQEIETYVVGSGTAVAAALPGTEAPVLALPASPLHGGSKRRRSSSPCDGDGL